MADAISYTAPVSIRGLATEGCILQENVHHATAGARKSLQQRIWDWNFRFVAGHSFCYILSLAIYGKTD